MADFRWKAIVTTKYDQIVEKSYAGNSSRLQTLVPFIKSTDRIDTELRDGRKIPLIKLHGCISLTDDANIPLILTTDQYNEYRKGREKLFNRFQDLAGERIVVYVGYRLADAPTHCESPCATRRNVVPSMGGRRIVGSSVRRGGFSRQ